jgi:hypothetical protein
MPRCSVPPAARGPALAGAAFALQSACALISSGARQACQDVWLRPRRQLIVFEWSGLAPDAPEPRLPLAAARGASAQASVPGWSEDGARWGDMLHVPGCGLNTCVAPVRARDCSELGASWHASCLQRCHACARLREGLPALYPTDAVARASLSPAAAAGKSARGGRRAARLAAPQAGTGPMLAPCTRRRFRQPTVGLLFPLHLCCSILQCWIRLLSNGGCWEVAVGRDRASMEVRGVLGAPGAAGSSRHPPPLSPCACACVRLCLVAYRRPQGRACAACTSCG